MHDCLDIVVPAVSVQGQDSEPAGSVPLTVQGGPIRMLPTSGKLSIGESKVYNVHWGICSLLLLGSPSTPPHTLDSPTPSPPILALSNSFSYLPTSLLFPLFLFPPSPLLPHHLLPL